MRLLPTAALAAAALAAAALTAPAQSNQQQQDDQRGQAIVRERSGPTVDIRQGQTPRVVVLFTAAGDGQQVQRPGQQQDAGGLQVVFLEREMVGGGQGGQPQTASGRRGQGVAQPTGREIVFRESDALKGVVAHQFDGSSPGAQSGGAVRQLVVRAEVSGRPLEVEQSAQQDGMVVMTVRDPQVAQQAKQAQDIQRQLDQARQQYDRLQQQQQQQNEQQQGQQDDDAEEQQGQDAREGQQGDAQGQQQLREQVAQAQQSVRDLEQQLRDVSPDARGGQSAGAIDPNEAVILVYLGPASGGQSR